MMVPTVSCIGLAIAGNAEQTLSLSHFHNSVRRLRLAGAEMFHMLHLCFQAGELFGQTRHGALDRISQDFRRRLGTQVVSKRIKLQGVQELAQTREQIGGFGASLTDSSAWLISQKLTQAQRTQLLEMLFGRRNRPRHFAPAHGRQRFCLAELHLRRPSAGANRSRTEILLF